MGSPPITWTQSKMQWKASFLVLKWLRNNSSLFIVAKNDCAHALSQQSPFLLILCNQLWFLINMKTFSLAYCEPGSKWKMSPTDSFRFSWAWRSVFVTNPASILSLNDYPTTLWTFASFWANTVFSHDSLNLLVIYVYRFLFELLIKLFALSFLWHRVPPSFIFVKFSRSSLFYKVYTHLFLHLRR